MKRFISCSFLVLGLVVVWSLPADAVDPISKCQSSKLKAWGQRRSCEDKEAAKAALGKIPDVAKCQVKLDAALLKAGTGCRYLSMELGTVTDLDTGLMWQKTDDNGGDTDKDNMYAWTATTDVDFTDPDGSAFTDFLAGLNDCESDLGATVTGGYAGHCDWRLPQIDELSAILLKPWPCDTDPCIDESAFGPVNELMVYWSATSFAEDPTFAWVVYFDTGFAGRLSKSSAGPRVRAVRGGL